MSARALLKVNFGIFSGFCPSHSWFCPLCFTKGLKLLGGISPLIMIRVHLCKQLQWELLFYSEPCAAVVTMQLFWGAILVNHITVWFLHICAVFELKKKKKAHLTQKRVVLFSFKPKLFHLSGLEQSCISTTRGKAWNKWVRATGWQKPPHWKKCSVAANLKFAVWWSCLKKDV